MRTLFSQNSNKKENNKKEKKNRDKKNSPDVKTSGILSTNAHEYTQNVTNDTAKFQICI